MSPFQTCFVLERSITVTQEMVHNMNRRQGEEKYFVIKVDFIKVYDMLNWSFILNTLNEVRWDFRGVGFRYYAL